MKCKYLKVRTKNYEKYLFCNNVNIKKKIVFANCKDCKYKEYKKVKELKKKSNKLKELESKRFSILTNNLSVCYICKKQIKEDLHEIFGGSNRQKSMIYGLVIPVCRKCHENWKVDRELKNEIQQKAKIEFLKIYTQEKFREEFGKYYEK